MEETCTLPASLDGLVQACYALGAILSLPFVPMFNDRFGRRWSIFFGSAVSIAGAIVQGFAQNGMFLPATLMLTFGLILTLRSRNVHRSAHDSWIRYPVLHHFWIGNVGRIGVSEGATFLDCAVQLIVFHRVVDSCCYHDGH